MARTIPAAGHSIWRRLVPLSNTQRVLEQKLGEGGFGEVWLGQHQKLKKRRVFKFCFRADRVRSLKRELTLFRLIQERIGDHPNIVALREVYLERPPYYVEEDYVAGGDLRTWCEAQGGADKVPIEVRLEIIAQVAYCATNDRVAFQLSPEVSASLEVRVWDLRSNAIAFAIKHGRNYFPSFAFSPDGQRLAGAGQDGAYVWDAATGEPVLPLLPSETAGGQVFTGAVAFDPAGAVLSVGHRTSGLIRLHRVSDAGVPNARATKELRLPGEEVYCLAFSPDGRWLAASAFGTNVARVWALPSGEPVELPCHRMTGALTFDPGSQILATGDGQVIRLWDLAGRRTLAKLPGHRLSVTALAFSPDGRWLASGGNASSANEGEVLLWRIESPVHPAPPDYEVLTHSELVAFEAKERSFLALADGVVTRFDLDTLRPVGHLRRYGSNNVSLAVSSDGQWLAHGETNGIQSCRPKGARGSMPDGDAPRPGGSGNGCLIPGLVGQSATWLPKMHNRHGGSVKANLPLHPGNSELRDQSLHSSPRCWGVPSAGGHVRFP